jgi:hypothetical protein
MEYDAACAGLTAAWAAARGARRAAERTACAAERDAKDMVVGAWTSVNRLLRTDRKGQNLGSHAPPPGRVTPNVRPPVSPAVAGVARFDQVRRACVPFARPRTFLSCYDFRNLAPHQLEEISQF